MHGCPWLKLAGLLRTSHDIHLLCLLAMTLYDLPRHKNGSSSHIGIQCHGMTMYKTLWARACCQFLVWSVNQASCQYN